MKTLLFFVACIMLLSACSKDDGNCVEDAVGLYSGNCSSNIGTFQGDMTITASSTGGSNLVIVDDMLDGGATPYTATLGADCNTITVPSQAHVTSNGLAGTISGSFQVDGSSLTGNLNIIVGSIGSICSYNLTKR